jgi:hypothetical protein
MCDDPPCTKRQIQAYQQRVQKHMLRTQNARFLAIAQGQRKRASRYDRQFKDTQKRWVACRPRAGNLRELIGDRLERPRLERLDSASHAGAALFRRRAQRRCARPRRPARRATLAGASSTAKNDALQRAADGLRRAQSRLLEANESDLERTGRPARAAPSSIA